MAEGLGPVYDLRGMVGVFAVALAIRLCFGVGLQYTLDQQPGRLCLIEGDASGYWHLAGTIVRGEDYSIYQPPRRVMRMPGFPVLLAIPRWLGRDNRYVVRGWLAVLGALACVAVVAVGACLHRERESLAAGYVAAISPTYAVFSVLLLSEMAFALCLTLHVWATIEAARAIRHRHRREILNWGVLAGLACAAATYQRPSWWPMLLVGSGWLALPCLAAGTGWHRVGRASTAMALAFACAMAPWVIRNAMVTGRFVPTTLWMGPSLYDGLNPHATGDSEMSFFDRDNLLNELSEYEMDREYRRRAWDFAVAQPGRVLQLAANKLIRTWSLAPNAAQFSQGPAWWMASCWSVCLLSLIALGLWRWNGGWWNAAWLLAPVVFTTLLHLLFVGSLRYRLPAELPMLVFAGHGWCEIIRWWRGCGNQSPAPATDGPLPENAIDASASADWLKV